jgi:hypothetical protein
MQCSTVNGIGAAKNLQTLLNSVKIGSTINIWQVQATSLELEVMEEIFPNISYLCTFKI